jgi:hypothetical protein
MPALGTRSTPARRARARPRPALSKFGTCWKHVVASTFLPHPADCGCSGMGMDLYFNKEHEALRRKVRELAEGEIAPVATQLDAESRFPWDNIKKMSTYPRNTAASASITSATSL